MKKIFNIFTALLLLSVVGCTKDVDLDSDITSNNVQETIQVTLNLSTDDTRVNVDGTSVTWSDYERIYIMPVVDDKYILNTQDFEIDPESISEDGKSASFIGRIYDYGQNIGDLPIKYFAISGADVYSLGYEEYYYDEENDITFTYYTDFILNLHNNSYIASQQAGRREPMPLMMVSDYFTLDNDDVVEDTEFEKRYNKSNIKFNNRASIVALNIYLDNATGNETMQSLTFRNSGDFLNGQSLFTSQMSMSLTDDGLNFETSNYQSEYKFSTVSSDILSSSEPTTYYIPVVWNTNIETIGEAFSDYFISFKTQENKYSATESIEATKILEAGHLYSCDVRFDANELIDGAPDQTAALLKFYGLLGGGERHEWDYPGYEENSGSWTDSEWDAFHEWINDAFVMYGWTEENRDLSQWEGVSCDDLGYVVSIDIWNKKIRCELRDEAIEALAPLTKLRFFDIQQSELTGELPVALAESSTIKSINLNNNNIEGAVPEGYGTFMANNGFLNIINNRLSGELPSTITDNAEVWAEFAQNNLTQQAGYGFSNLPPICLPESTLTSEDGTTKTTTEIFAENELTVAAYVDDYYAWVGNITLTIASLCDSYSDLGSLMIYNSDYFSDPIDTTLPGYVYKSFVDLSVGTRASGDSVDSDIATDVPDVDVSPYRFNEISITKRWPYSYVIVNKSGEIVYTQDISSEAPTNNEQIESFVNNYFSARK